MIYHWKDMGFSFLKMYDRQVCLMLIIYSGCWNNHTIRLFEKLPLPNHLITDKMDSMWQIFFCYAMKHRWIAIICMWFALAQIISSVCCIEFCHIFFCLFNITYNFHLGHKKKLTDIAVYFLLNLLVITSEIKKNHDRLA